MRKIAGGAIASRFIRLLGNLLSPGGRRARLAILTHHRVSPSVDPFLNGEVDASWFTMQSELLRSHFSVLPLEEAISRLRNGTLPARAVSLTFDDGYADNYMVALPILRSAGLHATFFVAPDYLDGGSMWNDSLIECIRRAPGPKLDLSSLGLGVADIETPDKRRRVVYQFIESVRRLPPDRRQEIVDSIVQMVGVTLPDDLMMTSVQVRALRAAGMGIGGHTMSHPILASMNEDAARKEIADGRDRLEGLIGERLRLFAYPNGRPHQDYTAVHVRMVRELGFEAAVSTAVGVASSRSDMYQLPRFAPWVDSPMAFTRRLLQNYTNRHPEQVVE